MITSLFRKSTPLNYSLVIMGVIIFFFLYQIQHTIGVYTGSIIFEKIAILVIIFASLFSVDFIIKRNGLSKDSTYTFLFYFLFVLFFPSVLNNVNIVLSNFFIILALRRMISMQSPKATKEKIFDASLWVFVASLFHFWSILFILLVFIAILFHAARDYRNWFLPFIAFFTVVPIFVMATLILHTNWIVYLLQNATLSYKLDYFKNNYQNLAFSIFATIALFFIVSLTITLSNRPLTLHASYKKIISAFFIACIVFIISPGKSNDLLILTFAPLAMMATNHIEIGQIKWQNEIVLFGVIICSLFAFFTQL